METHRISDVEFGTSWTDNDKARFDKGYAAFWRRRGMNPPDSWNRDNGATKGNQKRRKTK